MAKEEGMTLIPFFMVFGGCMSAIIAMEYVLKGDEFSGNLLTLTEFGFVMIQSIPGRLESKDGSFGLRALRMPMRSHALHAGLWVSMSVLANFVFSFNISVPIHTLFRSCNVIASVFLGYMLFQQRYTLKQLLCVLIITVGIFLGSVGDAKKFFGTCTDCGASGAAGNSTNSSTGTTQSDSFLRWSLGIGMLVFVQMLQGFLGHTQAYLYKKHSDSGPKGELAEEFLFTSHVVSFLPFIFMWEDIAAAGRRALESPSICPMVPIPGQILWLLANNLCQLICIKGVFALSAHYSPLTVNITLSVRKFLSVLVSIIWFGNPWTHFHSMAVVCIFGGVFAYSQCQAPPPVKDAKKSQ
eukprot:TRINITY_DN2103_c0_g3_i1.p1 TRINITY_DN2103_c0_g3~~TRINITY_DN2103_c0_g3_i1.p1  ORF type:complete len:371 (+),score=61.35 TRINITY_DN2103_c0_g3_i1:53-1114(+)